jgi:hypothetical protein
VPPIFPPAGWWNTHVSSFAPRSLVAMMDKYFDTNPFMVGEVPTEDLTGPGLGVCGLLLFSIIGSFRVRGAKPCPPAVMTIPAALRRCVIISAWVSLAAYSMKTGMTSAGRLIAPYYPLLLPSLLLSPGLSAIVRRRWWRGLTVGVLITALVVLVLSPDRPLWPAKTMLTKAVAQHPEQRLLERALKVYTVYAGRSDPLSGMRAFLAPDVKVVGFIGTGDDTDVSLWRPYGKRRVEIFLLTDPPDQIRQRVQYLVVAGPVLQAHDTTLDAWLKNTGVELVATVKATFKVADGPQPYYLVQFKP